MGGGAPAPQKNFWAGGPPHGGDDLKKKKR